MNDVFFLKGVVGFEAAAALVIPFILFRPIRGDAMGGTRWI